LAGCLFGALGMAAPEGKGSGMRHRPDQGAAPPANQGRRPAFRLY